MVLVTGHSAQRLLPATPVTFSQVARVLKVGFVIIHVMGFRRSGSSALVECLVDQGNAVGISGGYPDETALFTPGRPHSPLRYFRSSPDKLDLPGLLALITEGRLGLRQSKYSKSIGEFLTKGVAANRPVNGGNFPNMTYETFLRVVEKGEDVLAAIQTGNPLPYFSLVERLIVESFDESKLVVLNNDPPARHFWGTNVVKRARVVAVRRDSRSIIPDRLARDRSRGELARQKGLRRFAYIAVSTIRLHRLTLFLLHSNVQTIAFEDLLSAAKVRERWLNSVGIEYQQSRERLFLAARPTDELEVAGDKMPLWDVAALYLGRALAPFAPRPKLKSKPNIFRLRGLAQTSWKFRTKKLLRLDGVI